MSMLPLVAALSVLAAEPAWKPFISKAEHFSIELPGTPKAEKSKEKGAKGKVVTRTYTLDVDDGLYMIMATTDHELDDLSAAEVKEQLEGFRDLEKEDGPLVSERAISLAGFQGLEVVVQGKEMDSHSRFFVAPGRTIAIMCDVDHGKAESVLQCARYFDSFKLLDEKGQPLAGTTAPTPPTPATPPPAAATSDLPPATIDGLSVTSVTEGQKGGIALRWLAKLNADAGSASLKVTAKCLVGKKSTTLSKKVPLAGAKKGTSPDLEARLIGLPSGPVLQCELTFHWVAAGKKDEQLDLSCWPGDGRNLYGGPCGD